MSAHTQDNTAFSIGLTPAHPLSENSSCALSLPGTPAPAYQPGPRPAAASTRDSLAVSRHSSPPVSPLLHFSKSARSAAPPRFADAVGGTVEACDAGDGIGAVAADTDDAEGAKGLKNRTPSAPPPLAPETREENDVDNANPLPENLYYDVPLDDPDGIFIAEPNGDDRGTAGIVMAFFQRISTTPPLSLLKVGLLVLCLMTGNAMIVICLNFWLAHFPATPGRYTVFAVSGIVFFFFFALLLTVYLIVRRPNISYLRDGFGWRVMIGVGAMDTLNSALAVYAAPETPEVLQALFVALVPVYAAFFTKVLLKDPRQYRNRYVLSSFALIIIGVMTAAFFFLAGGGTTAADGELEPDYPRVSFSKARGPEKGRTILRFLSLASTSTTTSAAMQARCSGGGCVAGSSEPSSFPSSSSSSSAATPSPSSSGALWWSFIFFLSIIPTVLMNVGQTVYMTRYTYDKHFAKEAREVLAAADRNGNNDNDDSVQDSGDNTAAAEEGEEEDPSRYHPFHGDDTTVKLVMLATETALQSVMTLLLMPMDALPWFGSSASVPETWTNFKAGLDCLFRCENNLTFCCLYCFGFVLVYCSAAYLNQCSVTLCSMVSQLSAPITALVLVAFPLLNPSEDAAPWYASTISALALSLGTFLYVVWDEQTAAEKHRGEVRLKMSMLGLLRRDRGCGGSSSSTGQDPNNSGGDTSGGGETDGIIPATSATSPTPAPAREEDCGSDEEYPSSALVATDSNDFLLPQGAAPPGNPRE